jgi:AcrR family transcriptional regulator
MATDGEKQPRLDRPRSVRAHEAVVDATIELLQEGGYPSATIDAISGRSGVSKATIYKHWPSRTAVAVEAFGKLMDSAVPLPDTGTARGDFSEQIRLVSAFYTSALGQVYAQLLAAGVSDPAGARYFREYFLGDRRKAIAKVWQRALNRGEVNADVDVEIAIDVLFGPLIFRLLTGHAPLARADADAVADAVLTGLLSEQGRAARPTG